MGELARGIGVAVLIGALFAVGWVSGYTSQLEAAHRPQHGAAEWGRMAAEMDAWRMAHHPDPLDCGDGTICNLNGNEFECCPSGPVLIDGWWWLDRALTSDELLDIWSCSFDGRCGMCEVEG